MPKPVSLLVGNTMGCAPTCLAATASAIATARGMPPCLR
jgi:hypothetical protein